MNAVTAARSIEDEPGEAGTSTGTWLILAISMMLILKGCLWLTGFETRELNLAVEEGTARIERKAIGEVGDSVIRNAIQVQRTTRPFWQTILLLGDLVFEPVILILRALTVGTLFSALAALSGRPVRFGLALRECSLIQFYWIAGMALHVGLTIALRRTDIETSAVLLLPPGVYHASLLVLLRQVNPFAIMGWLSLALSSWRRGQANLLTAVLLCTMLALTEALIRTSCVLMVGGGMRLSILPDSPR